MKNFLAVVMFCLPAFGQMATSGLGVDSGSVQVAAIPGGGSGPLGFADLPVNWVDNTACNPPGGTYDTEVVLGTTNNIGPNAAGEAIGLSYALTPAGLLDAMNNWRDNADNAGQTPHFSDKWWRIKIPAGTVLHCTAYDANNACVSLPGKMNGSSEPTKCLVLESTTPLTAGQIVCSHGLPGFGGTRNPGCTTDKASMWKLQMEGNVSAKEGIEAGTDLQTPTNLANHIVIRDAEITMLGGTAQSYPGQHVADSLIQVPQNPLGTRPPTALKAADHLGFERLYLHGNDPGDASQVGVTGASVDASGTCLNWYNSGTVNTANTDGTHGTMTLQISSGKTLSFGRWAFGPTFTVGSTVNVGGTMSGAGGSISGGVNYTITAFDPTTSNTVLTVTPQPGTQTGVQYLQVNPPSQYTPGCGDDVERGISLNADNSWLEYSYIEKIHWWQAESHAASYGFDNGPTKIAHNWMDGGSNALFSGGAPADQSGIGSDNEIRGNYFGRDLNYRFLTGTSGPSPSPPWGCGPLDGVWNHNTCPFLWEVKNSFESKLGHRNLVDGNIIENSWNDSQAGFCVLFNVEAGSGGEAVGVFDPVTGLPGSYLDNLRFSNNWVRNCPQPVQMIGRGDMNTGNGGGITAPVNNLDFIGNLFSNIADTNQFDNPGHIWQWTSGNGGAEGYATCAMSYTGSSSPYTVTALCAPMQTDLTNPNHVTSIVVDGSHNVTIQHSGIRLDPTLCSGSPSTCVANGQTIVIGSGISGGGITLTPGSYAMTGTSGNWNGGTDGTGGTTIVYNDGASAPGTVCSTGSTCVTAIGSNVMTFASLAGKMLDISPPNGSIPGDGVYALNLSGIVPGSSDTTCTTSGYATGATAANLAIAGTVPTGLTVKYNLATAPSQPSATCLINNGAGTPKFVTLQGNTFLAVNVFAIEPLTTWRQSISNWFHDNVFADNDAATYSDVYKGGPMEGTTSFASWDPASFQFYHNVMQGRNSTNWSVVNCPGGTCTNAFPATVNCSGSTADATCLGYSGFMGSSPTVTYPSGACSNANAPFNCPLMALPWANNLTLSNLNYVGSSSYSTLGVNTGQLINAMTQTKYVCPVGANCGTHGPYPD